MKLPISNTARVVFIRNLTAMPMPFQVNFMLADFASATMYSAEAFVTLICATYTVILILVNKIVFANFYFYH